MNFFSKYIFWKEPRFFYLKLPLWSSISQKNFDCIAFSDPQQFSELKNVGPLGAGGGGERWSILADRLLRGTQSVSIMSLQRKS